ncbi:MAG: hypothetical protein AAF824_08745 [Bacteroidota bacterium]
MNNLPSLFNQTLLPIKSPNTYLSFLLLLSLFLFSCGNDQTDRSRGSEESTSSGSSLEAPDTQALLRDKEQAISSILQAYYQDLESEKINVQEYYAPVINTFFSQRDLSRSDVGTILINGFQRVENRRISLDRNSIIISQVDEGFEAVFEGNLSFTNSQSGQKIQEVFKNQVMFNEDLQITSYVSLDSKSESTPRANSMAIAEPSTPSVRPLIQALKNNDYAAVQQYVHPELGYFYITRPGAFDAIHFFSQASAMERQANTPWISELFSEIRCQVVVSPKPDFDCEGFSKEGCFLSEIASYERVSKLMKALAEYDYGEFTQTDIASAKKLEAAVTHELISTESYLSLLLGFIEGKWYILVVDPAVYDCSA